MNLYGLTDSLATIANPPDECPVCHAASRVGNGLCLGCLLRAGLTEEEDAETENLDAVLAEIEIKDTNWRLGNYEILEEIGRGGMGVIYRARQRHSRRIVAVKRVLGYHADSRETLERFRREAEAAASLDHPNILPIYEVSESEEGLPFFSMKFAPGGSLVGVGRALRGDLRAGVAMMAKVSRAVAYAHREGILHRDLKPGNILLDGRGEPLVSDFGLAKWLDANSDLTRTLTIFGTPGFIAPEQANGTAAHLSPSADIYSLGAILFDLLTGRPPFLGSHALSVIRQASEVQAPRLRSLATLADRDLETICARCLDRDPQARYLSAGDLAEDLERWLERRPIIARPVPPAAHLWRWARRNPFVAGVGAACLLLGLLAIGALASNSRLGQIVRNQENARRSVAIAPLEDLDVLSTASADARKATTALMDGLQSEKLFNITSTLSRFSEETEFWNPQDWRNVGASLGVRTILTGTTRMRDGRRRIVLRVIDSASGELVGRKIHEFDAESNDSKPLIALAGAALSAALEEKPINKNEAVSSSANSNPTSQEYLNAGKEYYYRLTTTDTKTSLQYFEKAVTADPQSAEAQALFALAWSRHFQQEPADFSEEKQAQALAAASMAIRLDPELPIGYRAQAALLASNDVRQAQEPALFALELDPGDVLPAGFVGLAWRMRGRPDLALRWLERSAGRGQRPGINAAAIADALAELGDDEAAERAYLRQFEFVPDVPDAYVGLSYLWLLRGEFSRAQEKCEDAMKRYADHSYPQQMLAVVKLFARDFFGAETHYRHLVETDRNGGANFYCCVSNLSALGFLRDRAGDHAAGQLLLTEAFEVDRRALARGPGNRDVLYDLAAIQGALGDREKCFAALDRAVEAGWIDYRSLSMDPRFDSVREDPRFQTTLSRLAASVARLRRQQPAYK